jgi:hypothetical protein
MSGLPASLVAGMASTATGWGVVFDGVLSVQTVTETRNAAAYAALTVAGVRVVSNCTDTECDCYVKAMTAALPNARLVPVKVEVLA